MYSVSIGDTFNPPTLHAYDNRGDVDVEILENNLNINVEGTYTITYAATNDLGTTTLTITVNVVDGTNPDLPPDVFEYYSNAEGMVGDNLLYELRSIISSYTHKSYDDAREILIKSDADLNREGYIYLIYDGKSIKGIWDSGATWNREHVWPDSKLDGASRSDLHNLRASTTSVNGSRGNDAFSNGSGTYGSVSGGWYPGDDHKGDVARIIFYMITRYSQLSFNTMGNLNMFLEWHYEDPVDDFERNRNEVIFNYQKNRNPYIDYPDFAYTIWGYPNNYNNVDSYDVPINLLYNYEYVDLLNRESLFIN